MSISRWIDDRCLPFARAEVVLNRATLRPASKRRVLRHSGQAQLEYPAHCLLQVLSVTPFEKIPLFQLFSDAVEDPNMTRDANQLNLLWSELNTDRNSGR